MILTDVAVKNRITVAVFVLLIVVAGLYSYVTLPREAAPDVNIPYVMVTTVYSGVSPEDIETQVTMKIEKQLAGLRGLKEMQSYSAESISTIMLEFTPDMPVEDALQYVRDRVDRAKPELPADAEEPALQEISIEDFARMTINISGTLPPQRMKALADELEDRIQAVPGVLDTEVTGTLEREIRIEIDADRLAAYGLTIPQVLALIPSENLNVSAGALETEGTKFNVRLPAEFEDPRELNNLILTTRQGQPIYLSDVAQVNDTFKDRGSYSRLSGLDTVTMGVKKRVGANLVEMADDVKAIVEEFQRSAPEGVKFAVTYDIAKYIRQMVSDLENNIASGFLLVLLVLVVFMGLRTSTIVALAMPLSMLMSFAVIQALGYTLNMIVLFSLVLAVGMLVDNAIVIVENIYRHMQLGYDKVQAAMMGTGEVAWPVITSTATTVVAFVPLLFWPGIIGDFMKYLPITMIITLSSSLLVALVVSPTVCAVIGAGRGALKKRERTRRMMTFYRGVVGLAIANPLITFAVPVLLLVSLAISYGAWGRGIEFFPTSDPDRAMISIRSPQGTNIHESDRLARLVEERTAKYDDQLENLITSVGGSGGGSFLGGGSSGGPHVSDITMVFHDFEVRERPSADVVAEVRRDLGDIAGAEVNVEVEGHGPPTGGAVKVRIIGKDFKKLEEISEKAKKMIASVPGLVNLRSDFEPARPELTFTVDRQRARLLSVDPAGIGSFLRTAIYGTEVGKYREFNDEYDIIVRLPLRQRTSIDGLLRLQVPNALGKPVPLSSLGEFHYKGGLGTITRVDEERVVTVTGDAEGRLSTDVLKDVQGRLEGLELEPGYNIQYAGAKEEQDKASAFLSRAFVIALLLIALILVTQFNSLRVPFIIMTTVVLSMIGVFAGLLVYKLPFGIIMTGIGAISLAGVVVNNAIVLLDYTRKLQARGMDLVQAALTASQTRLRPVVLTAVTTVLGLVPMAIGVSFDFHTWQWATRSSSSQMWRGMAVAVIFGLTFATVLTLVVIPTLYVLLNRIASRLHLPTRITVETDHSAPEPSGPSSMLES